VLNSTLNESPGTTVQQLFFVFYWFELQQAAVGEELDVLEGPSRHKGKPPGCERARL
jgi:hypothetical protein